MWFCSCALCNTSRHVPDEDDVKPTYALPWNAALSLVLSMLAWYTGRMLLLTHTRSQLDTALGAYSMRTLCTVPLLNVKGSVGVVHVKLLPLGQYAVFSVASFTPVREQRNATQWSEG
jgi:hypothetical protein